jgi:DnaJ-class molecular chaperone
MKFQILLLIQAIFALFDQTDYQIFEIQQELVKIDPKFNFYTALECTFDCSEKDINRQYRKKSLEYHPDKTNDPKKQQLYKLLTSISTILRNDRKRYDDHLKRGFPVWKGNEYVYQQFEPSFLFSFVFILFFSSIAQVIVAYFKYNQQKQQALLELEQWNLKTKQQKKKELIRMGLDVNDFDPVTYFHVPKPELKEVVLIQFPLKVYSWVSNYFTKNKSI